MKYVSSLNILLSCSIFLSCTNGLPFQNTDFGDPDLACSIPKSLVLSGGVPRDGIPALTDPTFVFPGPETEYLEPSSRVIGFVIEGEPLAVPLNILWWHEIINLNRGGLNLAITHCPLTGSSIVFHRANAGNAEFGVSGLLYLNNLIMYDRVGDSVSLWPQMARGARCGPRTSTQLSEYPSVEMTWEGWLEMYPRSQVVSQFTEEDFDYTIYPYGTYDQIYDQQLLFDIPNLDRRRPLKELTLGIPDDSTGGVGIPFRHFESLGSIAAVNLPESSHVIFWSTQAQGASTFSSNVNGTNLSFSVVDGRYTDDNTGSIWNRRGVATEGTMTGERLTPVPEAFAAFWFAWAAFYPDAELWLGEG